MFMNKTVQLMLIGGQFGQIQLLFDRLKMKGLTL